MTTFIGSLKTYCNQYHKRIAELENQKYDIELEVDRKALEVALSCYACFDLKYNIKFSAHLLLVSCTSTSFRSAAPIRGNNIGSHSQKNQMFWFIIIEKLFV